MAVYFARLEERPIRIKIGYSSNVWYRLQGLCNQFRQDVTVLAIVPGDSRREYALQERFAFCRVPGQFEIFFPHRRLLDYIKAHRCKPMFREYVSRQEYERRRRAYSKLRLGF